MYETQTSMKEKQNEKASKKILIHLLMMIIITKIHTDIQRYKNIKTQKDPKSI